MNRSCRWNLHEEGGGLVLSGVKTRFLARILPVRNGQPQRDKRRAEGPRGGGEKGCRGRKGVSRTKKGLARFSLSLRLLFVRAYTSASNSLSLSLSLSLSRGIRNKSFFVDSIDSFLRSSSSSFRVSLHFSFFFVRLGEKGEKGCSQFLCDLFCDFIYFSLSLFFLEVIRVLLLWTRDSFLCLHFRFFLEQSCLEFFSSSWGFIRWYFFLLRMICRVFYYRCWCDDSSPRNSIFGITVTMSFFVINKESDCYNIFNCLD